MKSLGGVQRDGRTGSRDSYWPPFPHQPICTTAVVFFCFVFELTSLEFGSFCRILRFNDVQRTLFSCWPVDHIKPTWYSFCRANCRRTKAQRNVFFKQRIRRWLLCFVCLGPVCWPSKPCTSPDGKSCCDYTCPALAMHRALRTGRQETFRGEGTLAL